MLIASDLPLALTAYEGGVLFGRLLPFIVGAALLAAGLRRRSEKAAEAPTYAGWGAGYGETAPDPFAASTPAAEPAAWPPAPPSKERDGKGLIIAGSVLLGLGVLSGLGALVERAEESAERGTAGREAPQSSVVRSIEFPTQIAGLTRDPALSEQALADAKATGELPPGAQVGAFTNEQDVLLVIAAPGQNADPEAEVTSYRQGLEAANGAVGPGTAVDPGGLGGTARCWSTDFEGTPGATCIFVDGGSILSTIDLGTTDVNEAGERGRQARTGTVRAG